MTDQLLTTAQVADRIQVTPAYVRLLIRRGDLAAVNVATGTGKGAVYRVAPASLQRYLTRPAA